MSQYAEIIEQIKSYELKKFKWTNPNVLLALIHSIESGETFEQSGRRFNINYRTVSSAAQRLRMAGIKIPIKPNTDAVVSIENMEVNPATGKLRYSRTLCEKARTMRAAGASWREIGEALGVSHSTASRLAGYNVDDKYRPDRADPTEPFGLPHA